MNYLVIFSSMFAVEYPNASLPALSTLMPLCLLGFELQTSNGRLVKFRDI